MRPGSASLGGGGLKVRAGAARGEVGLWHFSAPGVPLRELGDWRPLVRRPWGWGPSQTLPGVLAQLRPGLCARRPRNGRWLGGQVGRPGEGLFSELGALPPGGDGDLAVAERRGVPEVGRGASGGCVFLAPSAPSSALALRRGCSATEGII